MPEIPRPQITAQVGLIPIGKDPASGLWEFADLQTTAPGTDPIPRRDTNRKPVVTEAMGLVLVLSSRRDVPDGRDHAGRRLGARRTRTWTRTLFPTSLRSRRCARSVLPLQVRDDPGAVAACRRQEPEPVRSGTRRPRRSVRSQAPGRAPGIEDCELWLGRLGMVLPTEAPVGVWGSRRDHDAEVRTGIGTNGLAEVVGKRRGCSSPAPIGAPSTWNNSKSWERWLRRRMLPSDASTAKRVRFCTTCSATCGSGAGTGGRDPTCLRATVTA